MNNSDRRLEKLEDFLIDTGGDTHNDTVRELRALGIDTDNFFKRVHNTVEESYRNQLRLMADQQKRKNIVPGFLRNIQSMNREEMIRCFDQIRTGERGARYQNAAIARCRNKDASDLSEEELRSWLEDIGTTLGEPES